MSFVVHDFRRIPQKPQSVLPFGIEALDAVTGVPTGHVTLLLGMSKAGKTAAAASMAFTCHHRVGFLAFDANPIERLRDLTLKREGSGALGRYFAGLVQTPSDIEAAWDQIKKWDEEARGVYAAPVPGSHSSPLVLVIEDLGLVEADSEQRGRSTRVEVLSWARRLVRSHPHVAVLVTLTNNKTRIADSDRSVLAEHTDLTVDLGWPGSTPQVVHGTAAPLPNSPWPVGS